MPTQEEQALHLIEPGGRLGIKAIIGVILANDPAFRFQEPFHRRHRLVQVMHVMKSTIEDDRIKAAIGGLVGVYVGTEIAQAAKPRGSRMSGLATLGHFDDVY